MVTKQTVMELHPQQAAFLDRTKPLSGFVGGRGAGKTVIGAYDLLRRAKPNRKYMMVAPTYRTLKDPAMAEIVSRGRELHFIRDVRLSDMVIELGNGAIVLMRSGDNPNGLRGPNLSGVWMDEASLMKREAYEIVIACLREQGERGWLSATFTPAGRQHWTFQVFAKGGDDCELFHARTIENPFLPPDYYDMVRHQYSGLRAQQELEGLFVDLAGAEWPPEFFGPEIWFNEWPTDPVTKSVALDPSLGTGTKWGDYSAFVSVALGRDGKLYVDADLRNDRHASELVDTVIEIQRRFQPNYFGFEVNGFQQLLVGQVTEASAVAGVPIPICTIDNQVNKQLRIRRLTPYLSRGLLRFKGGSPGAELLVDQMRSFGPKDAELHDDGPDALEMAIRVMGEMGGQKDDGLGGNMLDALGVVV